MVLHARSLEDLWNVSLSIQLSYLPLERGDLISKQNRLRILFVIIMRVCTSQGILQSTDRTRMITLSQLIFFIHEQTLWMCVCLCVSMFSLPYQCITL